MPLTTPVDSLTMPVGERLRRIASGELEPQAWREQADAWSRRADTQYRASVELRPAYERSGPIRIGVKDTIDVASFATRLGLPHYRRYPERSATALEHVPHSSINAKLATPQIGLGAEHPCVNPYFPHLNPSGSSTGSAVAVAAGICDLAMGTDSTGSIRLPANACGVVGLRMTYSAERLAGVFTVCPEIDSTGWLARTAEDLAVAWDRLALGPPVADQPRRTFRVGVPGRLLADGCLPEIVEQLDIMSRALTSEGHTIVPIEIDDLLPWRGSVWELCARSAWDAHRSGRHEHLGELSETTQAFIEYGSTIGDVRHAEIRGALGACRATIAERFGEPGLDGWLLPTTSRFPRDLRTASPLTSTIPDFSDPDIQRGLGYSTVASFAGIPAITFPVAIEPARRAPISLQLFGPANHEALLIRMAMTIGELTGDLGLAPEATLETAMPEAGTQEEPS